MHYSSQTPLFVKFGTSLSLLKENFKMTFTNDNQNTSKIWKFIYDTSLLYESEMKLISQPLKDR